MIINEKKNGNINETIINDMSYSNRRGYWREGPLMTLLLLWYY